MPGFAAEDLVHEVSAGGRAGQAEKENQEHHPLRFDLIFISGYNIRHWYEHHPLRTINLQFYYLLTNVIMTK